mgnify:CR=1 FL=1
MAAAEHGELVVELRGVTKDYQSLRPLRIERLELRQGQSIAILGLDLPMAEVLVNLITGANLPDTGEVRIFGRATSEITDAQDWVAALDRFGLISDRAEDPAQLGDPQLQRIIRVPRRTCFPQCVDQPGLGKGAAGCGRQQGKKRAFASTRKEPRIALREKPIARKVPISARRACTEA